MRSGGPQKLLYRTDDGHKGKRSMEESVKENLTEKTSPS